MLTSSPLLVFFISCLFSLFSLLSLRLIGIDWDYHVDSVTYIETSSVVAQAIYSGGSPLNLGYFLLVDFLGSSQGLVVAFNIFIYSLTNYFSCFFLRNLPLNRSSLLIISLAFWFSPYRVYLSTTLLKDTLIIFLLLFLYFPYLSELNYRRFLSLNSCASFLVLIIVRLQSISYLLLSLRLRLSPRNLLLLISSTLLAFLLLQTYLQSSIFTVIEAASTTDMSFREYDSVPSFASYGIIGSFLRMLIWPFLVSTGAFIFLSPSFQFLFVALGSFCFLYASFLCVKRYYVTIYSYALLALTASITTGFTSFVRYSLPIQCISYLLVLSFYKHSFSLRNTIKS